MATRPNLEKNLDSITFLSYYYLKDELTRFCRQEGLQAIGGKEELTKRIAHYLDTGEKLVIKTKSNPSADIAGITEDSLVENNFVCSEKHRAFFAQKIGKGFSFNVIFQRWLKSNAGKSYKEAIQAYCQIIADKKIGKTIIDKQFEYNAYIRDFFDDNDGKSLDDAIKCWKYKKGLQEHNKYEKSDLIVLSQ